MHRKRIGAEIFIERAPPYLKTKENILFLNNWTYKSPVLSGAVTHFTTPLNFPGIEIFVDLQPHNHKIKSETIQKKKKAKKETWYLMFSKL